MKDSLFSEDLTEYAGFDMDKEIPSSKRGMRHSIRPRHMPRARPAAAIPEPEIKSPKVSRRQPIEKAPNLSNKEALPVEFPTPAPEVQEYEQPAAPALLTGWEDLHKVDAGARASATKGIPVVDLARDNTTHRAFDLLRTRLRQTTQENKWVNIGVTAPTTACGTTFTAVNLALSLSRVSDSRTVLMDFNLRDPKVMEAFDMVAPGEMQDYLSGSADIKNHIMRISDTLALGLNAAPDENAAETLQNTKTHDTLDAMRRSLAPELVIYDLPPMLVSDDVSAFLPQLDGVLLVSDGTQTTANQILECERMLDNQVPLLGVVLNRARASSIPRYS